jgi:hypothetical protein
MACSKGCDDYCDRWDHDAGALWLANSLAGAVVERARIIEDDGSCVLRLEMKDGRVVYAGVSGNLHDEAYFDFGIHEAKRFAAGSKVVWCPVVSEGGEFPGVVKKVAMREFRQQAYVLFPDAEHPRGGHWVDVSELKEDGNANT